MSLDRRSLEQRMRDHRPLKRKFGYEGSLFVRQYMVVKNSYETPYSDDEEDNIDLDVNMKNAVFRASAAVVSLLSYSEEERIFCGSGTIIGCDEMNGMYHGTILSSATLVRCPTRKNHIADNIKVDVHLSTGKLCQGQILACDMHYNLVLMKIQSDVQLATASLIRLDDSVKVGPSQVLPPGDKSVQLRGHSNLFSILPGEIVIVIGRYYEEPYDLMAAAGFFSIECCTFDCKELSRMNCKISEYGIGGPVVNRYGEVIGISFYAEDYTPFLPINIALRWLEHCKKNVGFHRLQLGMQLANLYTAEIEILEKIIQKFPDTSEGVIVEKVTEGSAADLAGIHPADVIVQCSGNIVRSFLQFLDILWDKAGEAVELVVIRPLEGASLNLSVVFDETALDEFNRWPLPASRLAIKSSYPPMT